MKRHALAAATLLTLALAGCDTSQTPDQPAAAPDAQADSAPVAPPAQEAAPPAVAPLVAMTPDESAELMLPAKRCDISAFLGNAFTGEDVAVDVTSLGAATVDGWLASEDGAPIESALFRIETEDKASRWQVALPLTVARPDIPDVAGTPGFQLTFDASMLPPGRFHLFLAYRAGGKLHGCDNGRMILVR